MKRQSRECVAAVLLAVLILVVFWPLGKAGFVSFDDPEYVSGHRHLQAGLTGEGMRWALTAFHRANWHPLTLVSHMLDRQLFGSDARGPHLVNVALHTLNALLVLRLLASLTGAFLPALAVAALFAFHPLHVESVAWISERKDVLSTLFWLLGLSAYRGFVRRPAGWRLALVALCLAAGLMAKPMLVTFPLTLLALDFWPLGRFSAHGGSPVADAGARGRAFKLVAEKVPLVALTLVSAALTYRAQFAAGSVKMDGAFAFTVRLANAVVAPVFYLAKLCVPVGLSVFYPHPLRVEAWKTTAAALLLLVITGLVVRQARRRPWLVTGWGWYLVTLAPVLGLIQVGVQAAADRYTYVPLLGIFLAAVWSAADLARGNRRRSLLAGSLGVLALVALPLLTRGQLAVWHDTFSLFGHALRLDPDNWLAHNSYGAALVSSGRGAEAIPHYRESIRINPGYALPHNNLAVVLMQQGDSTAAIAHYREAIRLNPGYADAWYNLGNAYQRSQRPAEAANAFRKAIASNAGHIQARNNLARILITENNLDEALAQLEAAERIDPHFIYTLFNLGVVLQLQGRLAPAEGYLRRVVSRDRAFPGATQALVAVLEKTGRLSEARALSGGSSP